MQTRWHLTFQSPDLENLRSKSNLDYRDQTEKIDWFYYHSVRSFDVVRSQYGEEMHARCLAPNGIFFHPRPEPAWSMFRHFDRQP